MSNDKLRRQIAYEAARMMVAGQESQYYAAKMRAGRRLCRGWVKRADVPTDQEVRDEISALAGGGEAVRATLPAHHEAVPHAEVALDRFQVYRRLLTPLETVMQNPARHPEGDALYHSLQVFELARDALPYDEEFQLAALLHDVGKAIDPRDHVTAGLAALNGYVTERTRWFIENHPTAAALREGTLGLRARRRLEASEDFETLLVLSDCDRRGRRRGAQVPDVDEALAQLRELAHENGAA